MSPTTEPMTGTEIARAVARIEHGISNISEKLDNKIDKTDQLRIDEAQNKAIEKVEVRQDRMLWGIVLLALSTAANVFADLSSRGLIQP